LALDEQAQGEPEEIPPQANENSFAIPIVNEVDNVQNLSETEEQALPGANEHSVVVEYENVTDLAGDGMGAENENNISVGNLLVTEEQAPLDANENSVAEEEDPETVSTVPTNVEYVPTHPVEINPAPRRSSRPRKPKVIFDL
jgi:hypothetical protein